MSLEAFLNRTVGSLQKSEEAHPDPELRKKYLSYEHHVLDQCFGALPHVLHVNQASQRCCVCFRQALRLCNPLEFNKTS